MRKDPATTLRGPGAGWRPELAMHLERRDDLGFIELLAENHRLDEKPREEIAALKRKGVEVAIHGVSLSLGSAGLPDDNRLANLDRLAEVYDAILISEHIAFVRAAGLETHHLLPVERTEAMLALLVRNINYAASRLSRPLVLENIASLFEWPDNSMDEPEFLTRLTRETDALLLLDVSNLYANALNHRFDPIEYVERLPSSKIAYMHVAGGTMKKGLYHDTHAHPLPGAVLQLVSDIALRLPGVPAMLERDDCFPVQKELFAELDSIEEALARVYACA